MSMTLLQRVEIGSSGAASIDFTSIPQIYTDLLIVVCARTNVAGPVDGIRLTINGTDIYPSGSSRRFFGSGSGTSTDTSFNSIAIPGNSTTANTFGNASIYISNYTGSTKKTISSDAVTENNATTSYQMIGAGQSAVTAAITSLSLGNFDSGGTAFMEYSTASLYGISRQSAIGKPKATGGTINYSNGYWYHTFKGSGSFSPISGSIPCEIVTVAGGAGGSGTAAGAGGAGGALKQNAVLSATHAVLVGAGGPNTHSNYNTGGNSMLIGPDTATLTPAYGGGGGGYRVSGYVNGQSGGSGGGGAGNGGNYGSGGSGVSGQGNAGGLGATSFSYASGGGGGAGAVGGNSDGTNGGTGGVGTSAYSSWGAATSTGHNVNGTIYYAGGGGGGGNGYASSDANGAGSGPGGYGGGGAGGKGTSYSNAGTVLDGQPGTANTGGGGGGGAQEQGAGRDGIGGAGGSGIVIIRYLAD